MKKWKKIVSVVLAAYLVVAVFYGMPHDLIAEAAEAAGEEEKSNFAGNGSFEDGADKPDGWGANPEFNEGTEWISDAEDGEKAVQLTAKSDANVVLLQSTIWGGNPDFD